MFEMLTSTVVQWLAPFVVAALGAVGALLYGQKKKREGHKQGREEELARSKEKVKEVEAEMKAEVEKPRSTEKTKSRLRKGTF